MEEKKTGKTDKKMIVGMALLILIFVFIGGSFWKIVADQAEKVKQEEALEEANAITAVYVETGDLFKMQVYMDMNDKGNIFTTKIPEEGIYNKQGKLVKDDELESGDIVKIYGNGIMLESFPGQYPGITKMKREGRVSLEELQEYQDILKNSFKGL